LQLDYPQLLTPGDRNILRYTPELCWDRSHANLEGARQFTEQVAADVRGALDFDGREKEEFQVTAIDP